MAEDVLNQREEPRMKETLLRFFKFSPCEDGYMAHMETMGGINVPVNVFADPGTDFFLHAGQTCSFPVYGIGNRRTIELFPSEEQYFRSGNRLQIPGMIPTGTFSPRENDVNFIQTPHILLTGTVTAVEKRNSETGPDYCLEVETLDMTVYVLLDYEGDVEPGYILHCAAWLFGDIVRRKPPMRR